MLTIQAALTESYVDALAPNAGAIKNGRDLARKNSFPVLHASEDGTLLFGECKGSGSSPYRTSADFAKPDQPVFRCSCPSRQFPCKHGLGLLYAYLSAPGKFTAAPIPEDIAEKRQKADRREEKTAAELGEGAAAKPARKTNRSALAKKIAAQLEGLDLAEKLLHAVVRNGLGAFDKRSAGQYEQQVKLLGNHYITGAQAAFRELFGLLSQDEKEPIYTTAMDRIAALQSLIAKGRTALRQRQSDPELKPDTESAIEQQLGHAWQLAELKERGLAAGPAELAQLSFRAYADAARSEYVDEGCWIDLASGCLHRTFTYRPFRMPQAVREEDSFYDVALVGDLHLYPGTDMNRRVRWDSMTVRPVEASDLAAIRAHAKRSVAETVKAVKNQLRLPLADKHPYVLLHGSAVSFTEDGAALADESGMKLALGDIPRLERRTTHLLRLLPDDLLKDAALLVLFEHRLDESRLIAQPISLITDRTIVRLLY